MPPVGGSDHTPDFICSFYVQLACHSLFCLPFLASLVGNCCHGEVWGVRNKADERNHFPTEVTKSLLLCSHFCSATSITPVPSIFLSLFPIYPTNSTRSYPMITFPSHILYSFCSGSSLPCFFAIAWLILKYILSSHGSFSSVLTSWPALFRHAESPLWCLLSPEFGTGNVWFDLGRSMVTWCLEKQVGMKKRAIMQGFPQSLSN